MLPNVVCIGAARSGTTSLYSLFDEHPDFFVPKRKECHFFTFTSKRFLDKTGSMPSMTLADYESIFQNGKGHLYRADISPSYLWVPGTPGEIKSLLPNSKIIVLLRNPIDRAISDFQYGKQKHQAYDKYEIEDCIRFGIDLLTKGQLNITPFHPTSLLWKGLYGRHLADYYQMFDRRRIKVLFFEDMCHQPDFFKQSLSDFLETSIPFGGSYPHVNSSSKYEVTDEVRSLLHDFYKPSVIQCEQLLSVDLSIWK